MDFHCNYSLFQSNFSAVCLYREHLLCLRLDWDKFKQDTSPLNRNKHSYKHTHNPK